MDSGWREAIAALEQQLVAEQAAHDQIATICFRVGADTTDGTSISAVLSLADIVIDFRQQLAAKDAEIARLRWHPIATAPTKCVEPIVCLMCAEGNKPVIHANQCWYHEFPAGSELCEAMSPTAFKTKFKRVAAQDDGLREEVPIIHGRAELVAHDAALIQKRDREWALVCAEHDIAALADSNGPIKLDSAALRASVREECANAAMEAFGHNETNLPHSDGCIACAVKQAILALASEKASAE